MRRTSVFFFVGGLVTAVWACSSSGGGNGTRPNGPPDSSTPSELDSGEADAAIDPKGDATTGVDNAPPPKVDVTVETITVGGRARSYVLAVPKTYSPQTKYPLIVALHGDGGDGATMRALFRLDDETGDDAIVAYPTGTNAGWDLYTPFDSNADQQFIEALFADVQQKKSIDPAKRFATGYSSGGFLINQLACRKPAMFAAMVSHAGGAPQEPNIADPPRYPNGYLDCRGAGDPKKPALFVHGTADPDFAGGDYDALYWAYVNGCKSSRSPTTPSPCLSHDDCPVGGQVTFCPIPGLNHFPPWASAAKVTWAFFRNL
jgi:polyhydroxybutyrate depolymerase